MADERRVSVSDLDSKAKKLSIIDMFLASNTPAEIAEEFGVTREYVEKVIAEADANISFRMAEIAEKVAIMNLARLERMLKAHLPYAFLGAISSTEIALKIMKLEVDWADRVAPNKSDDDTDDIKALEQFERTLTGTSPLYDIAQANLEDDWLSMGDVPVEELYKVLEAAPLTPTAELNDKITRLEAQLPPPPSDPPPEDDFPDDKEQPPPKKRGRGRPRKNQPANR